MSTANFDVRGGLMTMIASHATGHVWAKDGTLLRVDCERGIGWVATHYDPDLRVIQQVRGPDEEVRRVAAMWAQGEEKSVNVALHSAGQPGSADRSNSATSRIRWQTARPISIAEILETCQAVAPRLIREAGVSSVCTRTVRSSSGIGSSRRPDEVAQQCCL